MAVVETLKGQVLVGVAAVEGIPLKRG